MLLLLILQNWLIHRKRAWLGIVVPVLYITLLVALAATGRLLSLSDFVFSAFGLLGLLAWWLSVRELRRQEAEDLENFPPQTAATPGDLFPPANSGVRRYTPVVLY